MAYSRGRSGEVQPFHFLAVGRPLAGGTPSARLHEAPARLVARVLGALALTSPPVGQQPQRTGELATGRGQLVDQARRTLALG